MISGQRVIALKDIDGRIKKNDKGKAYCNSSDGESYIVWDLNVHGHDGDGFQLNGHCWNVPTKFIKLFQEEWDQ